MPDAAGSRSPRARLFYGRAAASRGLLEGYRRSGRALNPAIRRVCLCVRVCGGTTTSIDQLLAAERWQLDEFIRFYRVTGLDLRVMVNHRWDVQDLLAHIVAWHESFALNLSLLAAGDKPQPPRGTLRQVNREGVLSLRGKDVSALIRRLRKAQRTIEAHVYDESITLIPYRKPGTSYTRTEHLDVVRVHIHDHFWEVVDSYVTAKG